MPREGSVIRLEEWVDIVAMQVLAVLLVDSLPVDAIAEDYSIR